MPGEPCGAPHGTPPRVLYVGAALPARSETFVYREVFALRDLGFDVRVASVHQPHRGLGEARLDSLAGEAIGIYGRGVRRLLLDAAIESISHPIRKIRTALVALGDALAAPDVALFNRPKVIWQMMAGLALARRVRRLELKHVHAHMAHVPATIAMYAALQLGVPFSFTGHAADIFRSRTLLKAKLNRAAFVACISYWHREFYRSIVNLPDDRLPIVRCGVDVDEFAPPQAAGLTGAGRESPRVLAVGRLVPKKGFDLLLRALAKLRDDGTPFHATIVGDGPQQRDLEQLRSALRLDQHVDLAGAQSNQQVRGMLREADLFILPCRIDPSGDRDGIPVVLMEAMASGVCCISGDLPAIRELIDDGVSGRLVAPGEVEVLAAAMARLLADHAQRKQFARAGRARVQQEFSLGLNAERMAESLWHAARHAEHQEDGPGAANRRRVTGSTSTPAPVAPGGR